MKKPFFSAAEARKVGVQSRLLSYYVEQGIFDRIGRGVYRVANGETDIEPEWEDIALVAASIPNGTICLISALCYYHFTDEIMRNYWIAIPHNARKIKRLRTRIIRMRNMKLGRQQIQLGKFKINIFDRERTVLDAFRYLGKEIAIKALRAYLKPSLEHSTNLRKLQDYAKQLRVPIQPYLMSLTT